METIKLNFDAEILGQPRTFIVKVPYQDGLVATSEFCPTELLSGAVDLMAAIRGETLDKFISDCRMQLLAMSRIPEAETELDRHIGGLMAVVMSHLSQYKQIVFGDVLSYIDCFSLLLKASGFDSGEIRAIYPRVTRTITDLYPDHVYSSANGSPFIGSHSKKILDNLTRI